MTVLHNIIAPKENADDTVLVVKHYFKNGDKVTKHDVLMVLETSKTGIVIEAPSDGYVEYLVTQGTSVEIGSTIIKIHDENKDFSTSTIVTNGQKENKKIITKKAQSYINEKAIDITLVNKSFITLEDLNPALRKSGRIVNESVKALESNLKVTTKAITLAKQTEINALSQVQSAGLVSTVFVNVDSFTLPANENFIFNSSCSLLPLITFEVSRLLKQYPLLNAFYQDNFILQYVPIHIGVALDLDDGLKVYTIKDTDTLTLEEIEQKISEGIYSYFRKTLTPDEIRGSTFTITDLSSFGVDRFVPLINYKQAAVLGISSVDRKLDRFTLSLSFDHRVTEGKVAGQFLSELSHRIGEHSLEQSKRTLEDERE